MKLKILFFSLFFSYNSYAESTISLIQPLEIWQTQIKKEGLGTYLVTLSFSGIKESDDDIKYNRIEHINSDEYLLNGFASVTSLDLKVGKNCPFARVAINSIQGIKNSKGIFLWQSSPRYKANNAIEIFGQATFFNITDIKDKEAKFNSTFTYSAASNGSLKVVEDTSIITKIQ